MSDLVEVAGLTPEQIRLASLMAGASFDPDEKELNITAICEKAGVSRKSYYNWRNKPEFINYYSKLVRQVSREYLGPIMAAVCEEAKGGSFQHAKLFLQYVGELANDQLLNISVSQQQAQTTTTDEITTLRDLQQKRLSEKEVKQDEE